MGKYQGVSISVIKRLPRYYRFLGDLLNKNELRISSRELAQTMQLTASQIRQDLNCFGGFGQQGYGYNVADLYAEIGKILGVNNNIKTILIGVGNLGRAIAKHMDFDVKGFNLIGLFDKDPKIIGQNVRQNTVQDIISLEGFCKEHKPGAAILCIPKDSTQELADILVNFGVKGFWNFSHYDLTVDHDAIVVENVHLGDSLMTLSYQINSINENYPRLRHK